MRFIKDWSSWRAANVNEGIRELNEGFLRV